MEPLLILGITVIASIAFIVGLVATFRKLKIKSIPLMILGFFVMLSLITSVIYFSTVSIMGGKEQSQITQNKMITLNEIHLQPEDVMDKRTMNEILVEQMLKKIMLKKNQSV